MIVSYPDQAAHQSVVSPQSRVARDCGETYPLLSHPRYQSLDAWRGLACLMIVLLHAGFAAKAVDSPQQRLVHPHAWAALSIISKLTVGVPMFFVISGYCISATADSSRRRSHITFDYFKRRLRRIFPPYWAALFTALALYLLVVCVYPTAESPLGRWEDGALPSLRSLSPSQWLGNFTLIEQWRYHLFGTHLLFVLPPAWTLCYEEQFYIVCGLLLMVMPRRFFTGAAVVSLLTSVVFGLSLWTSRVHVDGLFFDGRWLMFAAGVLVYYCVNYHGAIGRWCGGILLATGIFLAVLIYKRLSAGTHNEVAEDLAYSLRSAGVFALIILLLRPFDHQIAGTWILAPLTLCGQMCYSLYLIHWPLAKIIQIGLYHAGVQSLASTLAITVPLVTAVSLPAGWIFYRLVEQRFLNPPRTVNACDARALSQVSSAGARPHVMEEPPVYPAERSFT